MAGAETTRESIIHVLPGGGDLLNVLGERARVVLSQPTTDPPFLLIEISSLPGGGPPMLHTHPSMEAFYVLEGSYEFSQPGPTGPETFLAGPGSVVSIPGGAPHNYKNVGTSTGRMLGVFTSMAMEGFFRDMSAATTDDSGLPIIPPDTAKLGEIMEKYEVAFVGGVAR